MAVVTDLVVVRKRTGLTEVWLDGAPWLRLALDLVVQFRLEVGRDLDDRQQEEIRFADEAMRARQALARYTALTLRTERQARDYLLRKGIGETAADVALERGRELGWLDDQRFAGAWVRTRLKLKPAGPHRLRADLAARGVDGDTAAGAIDAFGPGEDAQRALALDQALRRAERWRRRYPAAETLEEKLRAYLTRQGYEAHLIRDVVRQALEKTE